ncbi:MAG: DUF1932 domain-containing protein [Anaerolineae bacterium]|nr:DUF1932 domain-containing protein [Anaerolineae bacterium]
MTTEKIGILHPGAMGISVAAAAQKSGHMVYWASVGRSPHTQARAQQHHLLDGQSVATLCHTCTMLISVCPPHAAEEVAQQVLAHGFAGLFVDANAIAPQRARHIGELMAVGGVTFVDGGIIGGPAWQPQSTWLYLSGPEAERVAHCFVNSPLETQVIGAEIGKASALKMCYAAYTKGTSALLAAILGTAESLAVRDELMQQWQRDDPAFPAQTENRVRRVTAKAWRFAGEMEEIAATFEAAGLPGGFHLAAAEIYTRLADFKEQEEVPGLTAVLQALLKR